MAQVIADAAAQGKTLTLAELPEMFEQHWRGQLGDGQ
ncbi:hypothetical protein PGPR2_00800 [Pseudomonas aeruginosa PGPR2]|nr:hypothetical protein PGPR2_00800 [Pseudomonas aeruginosa PGPR2]